ncbi:MAG: hypothetical protein J6Z41_03085, partial [Prevotella sp.]|nr:hypothetical protein [Prevotella sp.]
EIGAGESKTFDVTFNYPEGNYGSKTANITVTPTYNEEDAFVIIASAIANDPDVWSEEFEGNGVPAGWTVGDNWTIEDGVAKGLYAYNSTTYLITPSLTVSSTDDELTFDYAATANYVSIAIQYSKDGGAWTNLNTISGLNNGDANTYTITGLEAGSYQFRFKNDDYNLDNFEGFKLNLADHILSITESNIPTSSSSYPTMKATIAFDATVTVSESRGVDEEVTAKVYMNGQVIGTTTETVNAKETNTITIIAIPTEAAVDAAMYIEVTYAGGTLTTETVTRTVAELKKLELVDTEATEITTGTTYDIITLSHSFVKNWNTFVAPLDVNISEFGDGAKVFEFTGYDGTLSFSEVTGSTLTKATPYVVYVPEAIAEVVFTWEDTSIGSMFVGEDNIKVTKGGATFQGTYAPMAAGTLTGKYGVVPSTGRIQKAGSGATMKGFRGYFTLPTTSANVSAMFYDADGIITAIEGISIEDGQLNLNGAVDYSKPVYNLSGQRVGREYKGVVIQNGKKIVVK